eukprot:403374829
MNENREFKHQSKNRRKQVKKLLNQIEGTVDVSNDYNYIRVIPERRYKDQQKKEIDLTEEIFSHTRNKSVETYNKLNTIYAKSPSQFNPDNEKVQEILRSDITLPVGYKPPKKTFYQLMKTIQAQNNGQLQSSNRVNDEGNYALQQSNYVIPGSKQEDTLIKDLKKMSTTQNAYGNYKKLGWKSTFIKYREKKEEMERMKQTIVEKVIAIQKQRDSEEKRLALRKQQQRLSVIMLREEERQRLENLKQLAIQEEDDYDSEYSSNFQTSQYHKRSRTLLSILKDPSQITLQVLSNSPSKMSNAFLTTRKNIMSNILSKSNLSQTLTTTRNNHFKAKKSVFLKPTIPLSQDIIDNQNINHYFDPNKTAYFSNVQQLNYQKQTYNKVTYQSTVDNNSQYLNQTINEDRSQYQNNDLSSIKLLNQTSNTFRFNRSFLSPTPQMHSKGIQERIQKYPVIVDKKDFERNKLQKVQVSSLVNQCSDMIQKQDIKKFINKHIVDRTQEQFQQKQFNLTSQLLQEIDHIEAGDMKPLYNYKLSNLKEERDNANEVLEDFRDGVNDPSREAAKIEKNWFLKQQAKQRKKQVVI